MKQRIVAILGAVSLLALAGCATAPDKPPVDKTPTAAQPAPAPELSNRETVTATATVKAIDLQNREVTLKGKNGKVFTIKVGDQVQNLSQVKVGDQVVVTYYEALTIQLTGQPGTGVARRTDSLGAGRAEPGQLPAGVVRDTVKVTANIVAVDKKKRQVLIRGAQRTVVLKVPADFDISKFRAGDQVQAEYVQELAIAIERAPAAPPKRGPGMNNKRS